MCFYLINLGIDGRMHPAWIKIGIAARECQYLELMTEPDPSLQFLEKEERRRVFWSAYILDRLVSCGRQRPPLFRDRDCSVNLPCDELAFRKGGSETITTSLNLAQLSSAEIAEEASPFAVAILACKILGCCASVCFDNISSLEGKRTLGQASSPKGTSSYWNPQTEHGSVLLSLVSLEARFGLGDRIPTGLNRGYFIGDEIDQQQAGHFLFSHIVFHLCYCLLYHPLLVWRKIQSQPFVKQTALFRRSTNSARRHAAALTNILQDAECLKWNTFGPFLAYAEAVASGVHLLGMQLSSSYPIPNLDERALLACSMKQLEKVRGYWQSAGHMVWFNSSSASEYFLMGN
jgi:hypothetical protein